MGRRGSAYLLRSTGAFPQAYAYPPAPRWPSWQAVSPEPQVFLPHHSPYIYHPFMPHYVAPDYVPPYVRGREKDLGLLMQRNLMRGSAAALPPGTHLAASRRHVHLTEAPMPGGPDADLFEDYDDPFDDLDLGLWEEAEWLRGDDDWLGAAESGESAPRERRRPFRALAKLFSKPEGGESKAVQLIKAAKIVQRAGPGEQAEAAAQQAAKVIAKPAPVAVVPPPAPKPEAKGVGTGVVVAGAVAGAALLGLGLWVGSRNRE